MSASGVCLIVFIPQRQWGVAWPGPPRSECPGRLMVTQQPVRKNTPGTGLASVASARFRMVPCSERWRRLNPQPGSAPPLCRTPASSATSWSPVPKRGRARADIAPEELAVYCLHALRAAGGLHASAACFQSRWRSCARPPKTKVLLGRTKKLPLSGTLEEWNRRRSPTRGRWSPQRCRAETT